MAAWDASVARVASLLMRVHSSNDDVATAAVLVVLLTPLVIANAIAVNWSELTAS